MIRITTTLLALALLATAQPTLADDAAAGGPTLYERLGKLEGIEQIVSDTIAMHLENAKIAHYFDGVDIHELQRHVVAFFAAGTGGPNEYQGRDMTTTHAGMDMSDSDFDSAVADVLAAVGKNVPDPAVADEVNAILQSLRPAVMGTSAE